MAVTASNVIDIGQLLYDELNSGNSSPRDVVSLTCSDHKRLSAHRVVLKVASPYFREQPAMADGRSKAEVLVPVPYDVMKAVLSYIYTSKKASVEMSMILPMFAAAKDLKFEHLADELKKYLVNNLKECLATPEFLTFKAARDNAKQILWDVLSSPDFKGNCIEYMRLIDEALAVQQAACIAATYIAATVDVNGITANIVAEQESPPVKKPRTLFSALTPQTASTSAAQQISSSSPPQDIDPRLRGLLPMAVLQSKPDFQMFQVVDGRRVRLHRIGDQNMFTNFLKHCVIRGSELFTISPRQILAFDLADLRPLYVIPMPESEYSNGLTLFKDQLYAWIGPRVYKIADKRLQQIANVEHAVDHMVILRLTTDHLTVATTSLSFKFLVTVNFTRKENPKIEVIDYKIIGYLRDFMVVTQGIELQLRRLDGSQVLAKYLITAKCLQDSFTMGDFIFLRTKADGSEMNKVIIFTVPQGECRIKLLKRFEEASTLRLVARSFI